jgi:hypothetical protein
MRKVYTLDNERSRREVEKESCPPGLIEENAVHIA